MNLALDTNAYRSIQDRDPALRQPIHDAEQIGIPIIVQGELRAGFLNGTKFVENEQRLQLFLAQSRVTILELTEETTWLFGEIFVFLRREGLALQHNDVWIAALCKQYDYSLATRDRDFSGVLGLKLVNF